MRAQLLAARRRAESLFTDTATVRRATGAVTTDPVTLEEIPVYAVTHSNLPCKIKAASLQPNDVQIPGQSVTKTSLEWHIPIATTGVLLNDMVTIDTVDPVVGDPDLSGKVFRVTGPFLRSYATARRLPVELVS